MTTNQDELLASPWKSSCLDSCWWSQTGRLFGPHSCWRWSLGQIGGQQIGPADWSRLADTIFGDIWWVGFSSNFKSFSSNIFVKIKRHDTLLLCPYLRHSLVTLSTVSITRLYWPILVVKMLCIIINFTMHRCMIGQCGGPSGLKRVH